MKKVDVNRKPLTDEELKTYDSTSLSAPRLTREEIGRLRVINDERRRKLEEWHRELLIEQKPLLKELRSVGIVVDDVWTLVNTSSPYPTAVPVLLKHLFLSYSDRIREGIARALAVPEARPAWHELVQAYRDAADGEEHGFSKLAKSGIAVALSAIATENEMPDLVSLVSDRAHGSSRIFFVKNLAKSKSDVARSALEDLKDDPQLEKEIAAKGEPLR